MKSLMILAALLSMTACATQQKVMPTEKVTANEGILLTNFHCTENVLNASVYKSGTEMGFFTVPLTTNEKFIYCNKGYQTVKLPEGKYFLSSFVVSPNRTLFNHVENRHIPENQTLQFTIQKQKINYIGDIDLATGEFPVTVGSILLGTTDVSVNSAVKDKSGEASAFLKSDQPHLTKNHPFTTSLAKR